MSRKLISLVSFVLVLTLASPSFGEVIGNFEGEMDGWEIFPTAPVGTETDYNDTSGVTLDSNSLKVSVPEGGYQEVLYIQIDDQNLVDEFFNNNVLSLDLTRLASEWTINDPCDPNLGYSSIQVIVNADSNTGGPVWDNLGAGQSWWSYSAGDDTRKVIWDYTTSKINIDPCSVIFLELIIETNYDPNYVTDGVYYLDNIQLSPRSYSTVIGDFENQMDGWEVYMNAPEGTTADYNDTHGITLHDHSLKVQTSINNWWMEVLTLNLVTEGRVFDFLNGSVFSMDVTRLPSEWELNSAGWSQNDFSLVIFGNGENWEIPWHEINMGAWWAPNVTDAELPMTVTCDYSDAKAQIDPSSVWSLNLLLVFYNYNYLSGGTYYFDNMQVFADLVANEPSPADEATDVEVNPVLNWASGDFAQSHDVYLGTDFNDVNNASRDNDPYNLLVSEDQGTNYYPESGKLDLEFDKTYYWRIDEYDGTDIYKGPVWSFTTGYHIILDNMDLYGDDINNPGEPGSRIYYVWRDGWYTNTEPHGNDTGSQVYHWNDDGTGLMESTIVRSGVSMPYYYENDGDNKSKPYPYDNPDNPLQYYSEASVKTTGPNSLGFTEDWLAKGAKSLVLWFYGDPDNAATAAEQMYVALEDGDNPSHIAVVPYDGDMEDIKQEQWHEWNIALSSFTGVNLDDVQKLYIGFGDRDNPQYGGSGIVYFDDIQLYASICALSERSADFARADYAPVGDTDGDCVVNYDEIERMSYDWLATDHISDPLIAWYKLDDGAGSTADDSSANNNNGTLIGNPSWVSGHIGSGALEFSTADANDGVNLGTSTIFNPPESFTIALWAYITDWSQEWNHVMVSRRGEEGIGWQLRRNGSWGSVGDPCAISFTTGGVGRPGDYWGNTPSETIPPLNQWIHIAAVYDAADNTKSIYLDGELDAVQVTAPGTISQSTHNVYIGARATMDNSGQEAFFDGQLDDVRLYDKALSQAEIQSIMGGGLGSVSNYHPVPSSAELYDSEAEGSKIINLKDLAVLAQLWLEVELWP